MARLANGRLGGASLVARLRGGSRLNEAGLLLVLVISVVIFALTATNWLTVTNLLNVFRGASLVGIIAIGMTLVIVAAEIDISVGSQVALTSATMGMLFTDLKWPIVLVIVWVVVQATLIGSFAGVLRSKFNIPSFIATLALYLCLRGLAEVVSQQRSLPITDPLMDALARSVFGIPVPAILWAIVFVIGRFVTYRTTFGRAVFAIGGNSAAARLAGLPVDRIRIALFAITGFLAGITGVLITARIGSSTANVGIGLEFQVIAAVIIGGTSLSGGRGTLFGTVIGVLFVTSLANALVLYGVGSSAQNVVMGIIVIIAVLIANLQSGALRQKN